MREPEKKPPVKEGEIVAGKYRVDRVLGVGGMGVVVAATHVELEQRVALKFILPHVLANAESTERFMREARALVRLKSEHVARVYDVGKLESGEPFTVMELLEGCDLAKLAKAQSPVRVADAVEYVLQACEAIIEAHAIGIVHRDLKPQNLFVSRRMNGTPLVKVLDFGISKSMGPAAVGQMALTDSTVVLGSPLYMAPEQMRSARSADARSDIWALGVILYELLAGKVPFDGDTVTELCLKVVHEPPPPIRALRPEVPAALVDIVMKCLEKAPERRFQNVAALAQALEPFSASAERGAVDRPWRSLVETADQLDSAELRAATMEPSPGSAPTVEEDKKGTISAKVTWHESSPPPPSGRARKRTFLGGLAAGAAIAALAFGVILLRGQTPAPQPLAAQPPATAIATATPANTNTTPTATVTTTTTATATATATAAATAATNPPAAATIAKSPARRPTVAATVTATSNAPAPTATSNEPPAAPTPRGANNAPILH
jgi:serine/threonine-protein kinase